MRRIVVAVAVALVAAKTGTTPDPMYEIDAVCTDWWHAEGCFDPANPEADRRWPSETIEARFTKALEGREPGRCASCGFGSTAADLPSAAAPGTESTDDDRQGCEPFCGDKGDAPPPPTPKPTTTLAKGGKADGDENESDGSAALSLSLATAVAALFAV